MAKSLKTRDDQGKAHLVLRGWGGRLTLYKLDPDFFSLSGCVLNLYSKPRAAKYLFSSMAVSFSL